jgi:hypothetical protein
MKIAGIVLLVLQVVAILGGISSGSFGAMMSHAFSGSVAGFSEMCGFLLPGFVGICLLIAHATRGSKKPAREEPRSENPEFEQERTQPNRIPVDPDATIPSRGKGIAVPESLLLYISGGPMSGGCFRCRKGNPVIMGRDANRCNLVLGGYTAISGLHCRLEIDSFGVILTDLGSSNGTWVESTRLTPNQPVIVPNGATVTLANQNCVFTVRYE